MVPKQLWLLIPKMKIGCIKSSTKLSVLVRSSDAIKPAFFVYLELIWILLRRLKVNTSHYDRGGIRQLEPIGTLSCHDLFPIAYNLLSPSKSWKQRIITGTQFQNWAFDPAQDFNCGLLEHIPIYLESSSPGPQCVQFPFMQNLRLPDSIR